MKDSRFNPITPIELPQLEVSVSLLCHFENAKGYLDWEIGTHGVRIEFKDERGHKKTATFLPEVPLEQGWNKTETIDMLLRKGGYRGNVTNEVRERIILVRYQSEKVSVGYNEYIRHRQRREGEN